MKRVLSALTLLPVVIAVIRFLPPAGTLVLAEAAALLALWEYTALAAAFGARVFRGVMVAGGAAGGAARRRRGESVGGAPR
jgi:CDP-diglyceride synthetase